MWTTRPVSRWIALLTLAVVMLCFASEGYSGMVSPNCCYNTKRKRIPEDIVKCYEQKAFGDCRIHAYFIRSKNGEEFCVKPTPPKLKVLLKEGKLECPAAISENGKLKVLKDME